MIKKNRDKIETWAAYCQARRLITDISEIMDMSAKSAAEVARALKRPDVEQLREDIEAAANVLDKLRGYLG